jgi:hypothetical protein
LTGRVDGRLVSLGGSRVAVAYGCDDGLVAREDPLVQLVAGGRELRDFSVGLRDEESQLLDRQSNAVSLDLLDGCPVPMDGDLAGIPSVRLGVVKFFLQSRAGVAESVLLFLGGGDISFDCRDSPGRQ